MLSAWLLTTMLAWRPPTGDIERARYAQIANDIVAVAASEAPLFTQDDARARTALLMLSVAYWESSFAQDVDQGARRGDSGKSWCLMQVQIGRGRTEQGWTGPDLIEDRRKCFRAGLGRMRQSFSACRGMREGDLLSGYVRGRCLASDRVSELRVLWAHRWWRKHGEELVWQ